MKYIIDTCSWIALAKYYCDFDNKKELYTFFKDKIEHREYLILDEVYNECRLTSRGIVVQFFDFITVKENITKTTEINPTTKDFRKVKDLYCYKRLANKLKDDILFDKQMEKFMKSADYKIILYVEYCKNKQELFNNETIIVTEETPTQNDHKLFKKIPDICSIENFSCITVPQLLKISPLNINIYR